MTDPDLHEDVPRKDPAEPAGWFERHAKLIVYGLAGLAVVLLAVDPFVHKHGYFEIEHLFGFYGLVGLGSSVVLVGAAIVLRTLLRRGEDFYDDR